MKPSLKNPLDHFILHIAMNDLSSEKSSVEIAESINMACRLKSKMHGLSVSTIILITNDKKINKKGMEVNLHLKEKSKEKNILFIDNSRKIKAQNLTKVVYI